MTFSELQHIKDEIKLVTINPIEPTGADIEQYLNEIVDLTSQEKKFVLLIDIRKGKYLKSEYRTKIAKAFEVHEKLLKEKIHCLVYVSSPIMNVILKTTMAFAKQVIPYKIMTDLQEALNYGDEVIAKSK